jgi:hypothetical protein
MEVAFAREKLLLLYVVGNTRKGGYFITLETPPW